MLSQNPDIFIPERKALHFFDRTFPFRFNFLNFVQKYLNKSYEGLFKAKKRGLICGEATPSYMYWESAPVNIWRYNHDMKWIIILRHPVYRARSAWSMNVERNIENLSFMDAINAETHRMTESLPYQNLTFSYLDRGYYSSQIRKNFRIFGREKVFFLTMRQFSNNSSKCLDDIFKFLNVRNENDIVGITKRKDQYRGDLNRNDYVKLLGKFKLDIAETAFLTGIDLSSWLMHDYLEGDSHV